MICELLHNFIRVGFHFIGRAKSRNKANFPCHHFCPSDRSLTPVNAGELPPEIDERGQLIDAILLGVSVVVDLDECDVERVGLVVDPLQALENPLAAGAAVCAVD